MDKVFLRVRCNCTPDGDVTPLGFDWVNGRYYEVDRVLDRRRAPSLVVGGMGIRYTCRVKGRTLYLFRDGDRWYAEPA